MVDVLTKATDPRSILIYERGHMCRNTTPMKKIVRFVPRKIIKDW